MDKNYCKLKSVDTIGEGVEGFDLVP